MMRHKGWYTLLGFVLFFLGFLSIILSMIGVQFTFMKWMDMFGKGWGFLARLLLIATGIIIIILDQRSPQQSE